MREIYALCSRLTSNRPCRFTRWMTNKWKLYSLHTRSPLLTRALSEVQAFVHEVAELR